jgi:polysaccharide deacetylase 2 family uncharacterized protein YibQ
MSDAKASPRMAGAPGRFRPLGYFWAAVIAIAAGGGVTLQLMGPPRPPSASPAISGTAPAGAAAHPAAQASAARSDAPAAQAVAKLPDPIAAPDPALQEPAPDFAGRTLPQKAPDGRAPLAVYKAPFDKTDKHPRVVLVVDGAGLNQEQTMHLLDDVPGPVDVAFSAYMPEDQADHLAAEARRTGHECLLSIPMEPNNFPLADEGARQLMQNRDSEANRQDLEFALSRLPGCVGATGASDGMLGERFPGDGLGFSQVLEEVGKRGLLYLDTRTGAPALSSEQETPISLIDLVIDQPPNADQPLTADMIDQRLGTLETLAAKNGVAIGLAGPPQPVMLERIAIWARGLAARGITLAPLTAVTTIPKTQDDDSK